MTALDGGVVPIASFMAGMKNVNIEEKGKCMIKNWVYNEHRVLWNHSRSLQGPQVEGNKGQAEWWCRQLHSLVLSSMTVAALLQNQNLAECLSLPP